MKLIFSNGTGHISNATGSWIIGVKPDIGFVYDGIFYSDENDTALRYESGGRSALTQSEVEATRAYLLSLTMPAQTPPALADVKALKIAEIKSRRDHLTLTGGHKIGTEWYHSNEISLIQQIALNGIANQMLAAGAADSTAIIATPWKTLNGTYVTLTVGIAKQFVQSALTQQSALFAAAQSKLGEVESLTAVADVVAYDANAGFPAVYQ